MNLYKVTLILGDIVTHEDYLHASTSQAAEGRLKREWADKYPFDKFVIVNTPCNCGSFEDVANYYYQDKQYIHCRQCRFDFIPGAGVIKGWGQLSREQQKTFIRHHNTHMAAMGSDNKLKYALRNVVKVEAFNDINQENCIRVYYHDVYWNYARGVWW